MRYDNNFCTELCHSLESSVLLNQIFNTSATNICSTSRRGNCDYCKFYRAIHSLMIKNQFYKQLT